MPQSFLLSLVLHNRICLCVFAVSMDGVGEVSQVGILKQRLRA